MIQAKADKYFNIEASICRRLKGCKGVPTFLGVAGADVYLVWKYEGSATLENVLRSRNPLGDLADALGTPKNFYLETTTDFSRMSIE